MAAWIIRAIWSDAPPAPAATTISTGLVGSHAAAAPPLASTTPASAPAKRPNPLLMSLLLMGFSSYAQAARRAGAALALPARQFIAASTPPCFIGTPARPR